MFAVLAVIAFAVALILHLVGGPGKVVEDAWLLGLGLVLVAVCLAWPVYPWRGRKAGE